MISNSDPQCCIDASHHLSVFLPTFQEILHDDFQDGHFASPLVYLIVTILAVLSLLVAHILTPNFGSIPQRRRPLKNFRMAAMVVILDIRRTLLVALMPPTKFQLNIICGSDVA